MKQDTKIVLKRWKISIGISAVVFSVAVLIVYVLTFDKSWYHIDVVENYFIRFLFFASMLLGAYFREREERTDNHFVKGVGKTSMICIVSVILYFAVRIAVPRFGLFSIQFLTWIAILIALYWIFRWAGSLELYLLRLPAEINCCMTFAAVITLQIYLVQFPIIERFEGIVFPLNLLIITVVIIAAAVVVYLADYVIQKGIDRIFHHSNRK